MPTSTLPGIQSIADRFSSPGMSPPMTLPRIIRFRSEASPPTANPPGTPRSV